MEERAGVPVKVALFVHVRDALKDLVHVIADCGFWEWLRPIFHAFIHILLHKLENQMQVVILANNFL